MRRLWWIAPAVILALTAADASAQGRGQGKAKHGKGPAFCRSGAGHPVFGWDWCEQRGWGTSASRSGSARPVSRDQAQRRDPYPDRDRNRRVSDLAFDNGYADGYEKGLDDGRDGRQADPTRHGWYRDADRNYDSGYGSRAQYANVYREGFRSGYEAGFSDGDRYRDNNGSGRWPNWPF